MSMFKVGKGSPGVLNSITPQKLLPLNPPLPLGISNDLPWWGYGYFLEPVHIQQKFQFEILWIGTVHSGCTDPIQATACYCSCMQVTKEQYWGQQFCQVGGTFQFDRPKWQDQSKWTTFKAQSWIFQSDQTEMVRSIWWTNQNKFWNFGLNGKRPRTPLSQGY